MYPLHFPQQSNKFSFYLLISIYSLFISTQTIASSNDVQQHEIIFRVPDIRVPNFKNLAESHDKLSIDQIRNKLVETQQYIKLDPDGIPIFEYKTNQEGGYEKIDRNPHPYLFGQIAPIQNTQLKDLKANTGINISLAHQVESDIEIGESDIFYENHINRADDDSRCPVRCVATIDYACITFPDNIRKIDYTQLGLTQESTVEECSKKSSKT
ncbi:MAG: hypothetical protein AAF380_00905 [Bacteroidota bacterium]